MRSPTALLFLTLVWSVLTPSVTVGQVRQELETGFERAVNRYRWNATARLAQQVGSWQFSVDNRFASDAFILFDDRLNFRDENVLTWSAGGPLADAFGARFRGRTLWYSQSRVLAQEFYSGLRYSPVQNFYFEPALGVAWDRRPGAGPARVAPLRMDYGPAYATRLAWTPSLPPEYQMHVEADGAWQAMNPRRGHAVRVEGHVARDLDEARLSAHVRYSNFRRDSYQAVSFLNRTEPGDRLSETVEATTSDTLLVGMEIETPVYGALRLTGRLTVGANNRLINTLRAPDEALFFDTAFDRRRVDGEIGVAYGLDGAGPIMIHVAARMGAEDERRRLTNRDAMPPAQAARTSSLLQQADYDQGFFTLQARSRLQAGRYVVNFAGSSSILRHDTPEANLDDRDELYHNGSIGLQVPLSRYLEADVQVLGTYYHTVFLNAARSAENSVQRSLRLRPTIRWTPSERTRIALGSQIRATYTVHDFVLPGRRAIDQSARELRYDASVEQRLAPGLDVLANGGVSVLHLGRLLWNQFAEIPFDTLHTYSGWVRLQRHTTGGATLEIGVRLYVRSSFGRSVTVSYPGHDESGNVLRDESGEVLRSNITRPGRTWIEQIGPTCSISWPIQGLSTLRVEGWLNVQHIRRRLYGHLPDGAAERIRRAARAGDRLVIPNLSMVASWRL